MTDPLSIPARPASRGAMTRRWLAAGACALSFVVGGLTLPVVAASAQDAAMHHGVGMHGDMHGMAMAHLDKMLTSVDATPDQKAKIKEILGAAMKPMAGAPGKMHEGMAQLHALLTAPTIDRAALERLRAEHVAAIDQMSRTMVQAMADAAEVLTPQQRAKLGAEMAAHASTH